MQFLFPKISSCSKKLVNFFSLLRIWVGWNYCGTKERVWPQRTWHPCNGRAYESNVVEFMMLPMVEWGNIFVTWSIGWVP